MTSQACGARVVQTAHARAGQQPVLLLVQPRSRRLAAAAAAAAAAAEDTQREVYQQIMYSDNNNNNIAFEYLNEVNLSAHPPLLLLLREVLLQGLEQCFSLRCLLLHK